ncbi:MAG: peptide chain release factor N(5)-glutamine methyltransferase [Nitriliruptorales bacterium]|nr:peptide chain release factor N(5)-glutamine methyltransferase [Nitriliruptorales bacterium]
MNSSERSAQPAVTAAGTPGVTVAGAVARLSRRLRTAGVPAAEIDASLLVRHILGWSAARLITDGDRYVPFEAVQRLEALAARRAAREPLQLLVGSVAFRYLDLGIRPGVFIPRPETEVLAGEAIERTPPGGVVLEPCTGSGAVACAVAHEAQPGTLVASDRSPRAVTLARSNAARAGLDVRVVQGDLLAPMPLRLRGMVDVLVSNPPYLATAELAGLEPEVRDHDPVEALVAGPTGHEVSDRLLSEGPAWLRPGGWLLIEVDERRAAESATRAEAAGLADADLVPDLAGRDRIVRARRPLR